MRQTDQFVHGCTSAADLFEQLVVVFNGEVRVLEVC
jgi:hypothetical protein